MAPVEFRETAALSTLVIFESFAAVLFALFLYAAIAKHSGWSGVAVVGTVAILIFIWWRSFLCEIRGGFLIYRSLFSRPPRVRLSDIRSAKSVVKVRSRDNRPPNRVEIQAVENGKPVAFDINMKPFSLRAVRLIEEALEVSASNSQRI